MHTILAAWKDGGKRTGGANARNYGFSQPALKEMLKIHKKKKSNKKNTNDESRLEEDNFYDCSIIIFLFFPFIFISWRLITLQYCSGFCHTLT